jgi:hypothetical protein
MGVKLNALGIFQESISGNFCQVNAEERTNDQLRFSCRHFAVSSSLLPDRLLDFMT